MGGNRTTTIDTERFANPTFALADAAADAFRAEALGDLGLVPSYYAHMATINRRGPRVLGRLILPPALDPASFERAASTGMTIVDTRPRDAFAAGHLPGSINIELDSGFAGYVGWLVPFGAPLLLVLPDGARDAAGDATTELLRIGYEWITGVLGGGVEAWAASGRPLSSYPMTTMPELHRERAEGTDDSVLLDVRQPIEWASEGVVAGSKQIFVADVPTHLGDLPRDRPVTVFCRTGHRASMAASVLDAAGFDVRLVGEGGAATWPAPLVPVAREPRPPPGQPARP